MLDVNEALVAVLVSIAMSVGYSVMMYGKKWLKAWRAGEKVHLIYRRIARTAVQGVFIGAILWRLGMPVTSETLVVGELFLTSSGLLVFLVDTIMIMILRAAGWKEVPEGDRGRGEEEGDPSEMYLKGVHQE